MADVYLAVQRGIAGFARLVVIKRLRCALAEQAELVRTLYDEARALSSLTHPNIVQILDVDRDAAGPFVVVEYLQGETLLTMLRQLGASGRAVPWPQACRIVIDLCAALGAAHTAVDDFAVPSPIYHRDLTPSNVVVCYSGAVKLIDFGIAKVTWGHTRTGTVKGKMSYLAPEVLGGAAWTARSDLFQVGVLLHESIRGRRLFGGADDAQRVRAVLNKTIPALDGELADVPTELGRLVQRLLERDPERRPAQVGEVRSELEDILARHGPRMGGHDLSSWMRTTFADTLQARLAGERACMTSMGRWPEPVPPMVAAPMIAAPRAEPLSSSEVLRLAPAVYGRGRLGRRRAHMLAMATVMALSALACVMALSALAGVMAATDGGGTDAGPPSIPPGEQVSTLESAAEPDAAVTTFAPVPVVTSLPPPTPMPRAKPTRKARSADAETDLAVDAGPASAESPPVVTDNLDPWSER